MKTKTVYRISIDYQKSLDEMVGNGKYQWVSNKISAQNFPIQGKGKVHVDLILVHFNRDFKKSDDIILELDRMDLQPARIEHAAAFGEQYPNIQCDFPILFFGSVWTDPEGYRLVPYLGRADSRRFSLRFWTEGWDYSCRFAAVHKAPPSSN